MYSVANNVSIYIYIYSQTLQYGHVMRRDQEYVGRKMMEMDLPEKRKRGRPKRKFLDVVKEDMEEIGAKETGVKKKKDLENDDTLWPSLTEGKGRKEKNFLV